MIYFDEDYIRFFKELKENNSKEWFDANRKRYENSVKKPFLSFIHDLIQAMNDEGAELSIQANDCISRINRDIRFSKDKTPYNLHLTAFISSKGKKDKSIPGFFIRFTAEKIGMMVGTFGPDKKQLLGIRTALSNTNGQFEKMIYDKEFFERFGEIKGEIQKRMPPEFREVAEKNFHITLKQLYFVTEIDNKTITSDKLLDTIMQYYLTARPINEFLLSAIEA